MELTAFSKRYLIGYIVTHTNHEQNENEMIDHFTRWVGLVSRTNVDFLFKQ